jgi:hypothetical protein
MQCDHHLRTRHTIEGGALHIEDPTLTAVEVRRCQFCGTVYLALSTALFDELADQESWTVEPAEGEA